MSKDSTLHILDREARLLLQQASEELVRIGDSRGLVALVEQWCATESVPSDILIYEVRALLDLKLMDRAWARLRDLSERTPDDCEILCLTSEMFIERGWPARAEKILKPLVSVGGYPDVVDDLFLRSQASAIAPPANSRDIERGGTDKERMELAECLLATGAHLRARSVLERIRQGGGDLVSRAEDLIWGLDSGFDNENKSLLEMASEITGTVPLADSSVINLNDLAIERTSEVTVAVGSEESYDSADPSFPSLFRTVDIDDEEDGVAESTKVTSMSSLLDDEAPETTEQTAGPGLDDSWENSFEDTRVMVVVSQDQAAAGSSPNREGLASKLGDEFTDFELDDSGLGFEELLEGEDADLIVLTNEQQANLTHSKSLPDYQPMKVVEPGNPDRAVIAKEPEASEVQESPRPPKPKPAPLASKPKKAPPEVRTPKSKPKKRKPAPVNGGLSVNKMLRFTLVVAVACVVFVLYASNKKQKAAAGAVVTEILVAVSGVEPNWQVTSDNFERRVFSGFDSTRRNELGLVILDMLRWNEAGTVDTSANIIRERLLALEDDLSDSFEYSLALAEFAFIVGDYEGLSSELEGLEQTGWAEVKHLRSLTMLQANNLEAARIFATSATELAPNSIRYLSSLGEVCSIVGDMGCVEDVARELAQVAPNSNQASIMEIATSARPIDDDRLDAVLRRAPNRISSQSLLWFANLAGEEEVIDQAVDRALGIDPDNRMARFLKGVRRLGQGDVARAEGDFTNCLELMPASFDCQLGLALSQFELDHVDEATRWITRDGSPGQNYRLNPVLTGWLTFEQGIDPSGVSSLGEYRVYLTSIGERDGEALLAASEDLLDRGGVINEFLGARGLARAARFGVEQSGVADRAYALAPEDPVVLTDLGWVWDKVGYDRKSSYMFRVALERGAESAYTLVERGRFFMDFGDNFVTTRSAWQQYRDLNPTGPRSESRLSNLERL